MRSQPKKLEGYVFPTRYTLEPEEVSLDPELKQEIERIRLPRERYEFLYRILRPSWAGDIPYKTSFLSVEQQIIYSRENPR